MKINFVMDNGAVIRGNIKIHPNMDIRQFLRETSDRFIVTNATIDFINKNYDSAERKILVTKKSISFSYEIV